MGGGAARGFSSFKSSVRAGGGYGRVKCIECAVVKKMDMESERLKFSHLKFSIQHSEFRIHHSVGWPGRLPVSNGGGIGCACSAARDGGDQWVV